MNKKQKIVIFGAGVNGRRYYHYVKNRRPEMHILAVIDNYAIGTIGDLPILRPNALCGIEYDSVVITNENPDVVESVKLQLSKLGALGKIVSVIEDKALMGRLSEYSAYDEKTDSRVRWLRSFAEFAHEQVLEGSVAECGVFMGDFSYYINKYFSEKTLYLFDTFSGFAEADVWTERELGDEVFLNGQFNNVGLFANTSEQLVVKKMLHPEKCVIRKGYFPETAQGLDDKFCFVMLDMDLYQPMLAGLEFFYDRMTAGGVMLLHDYFHLELPGVKKAVEEFEKRTNQMLCKMPIGDFCSIAIVKTERCR